jgi:hypothetical protein
MTHPTPTDSAETGMAAKVAEPTDLIAQARGRAAFLRDRGEVKTPDLLESIAARLANVEAYRDELDFILHEGGEDSVAKLIAHVATLTAELAEEKRQHFETLSRLAGSVAELAAAKTVQAAAGQE